MRETMKTIEDLPLFPLNTVLFPGMLLPLHIFEPRYRQMIRDCIDQSRPFGVVLIRPGTEALGPLAIHYDMGCTAKIVQVQKLKEDRMNIVTVGRERFRIIKYRHEHMYLSADVKITPFEMPHIKSLLRLGEELRPWIQYYLKLLSLFSESEFESDFLPESPLPLALTGAQLLQIETYEKQPLLAAKDAVDLLRQLLRLYRRETALIRHMLESDVQELFGDFSLN